MAPTMTKPLSIRAVLAAGALIAAVLAAGTAPAGAVTDRPDHASRLSACVGAAAADQMFSDVSSGHAFRSAIDCIAYYEITKGTGDGLTYSPDQDVTRAQMAVFIARTAEVAGVDLGPAVDAGFDDIDQTWDEARDAINLLASNSMIPSGGSYRPGDAITRAEMATFLIGLLAEAAPNVTKASDGVILLGVSGSRSRADDRFPDTPDAGAAALYELGVTTGAVAADVQDASEPPLDYNYEPDGTVNRGRMAAFITRALAHTSVRPAGVAAQFDGVDVVVSVRDEHLRPVAAAAVDVFWAPSSRAAHAVSAGGACRLSEVTQADTSSLPCEIDVSDPLTSGGGDVRVAVAGLRRVPEGGATVWVWTGTSGETFNAGADRHRFDVAEGADLGIASEALVTTAFSARKVRFGRSVIYTVQLRDIVGDVPNGVDGAGPAQWTLTLQAAGEDPDVRTLVSDSSGEAVFSVSAADPDPGADSPDVTVTYTLAADANAPSVTVGADRQSAATGTVVFSDDAPSIASGSAIVTIDTRDYVYMSEPGQANTATVTVLDQYGDPYPGALVALASNLPGVAPDGGAPSAVGRSGSHRFTYRYSGSSGATETLTVSHGAVSDSLALSGVTATVHWMADAGIDDGGAARSVLGGAVRSKEIVVDGADGPVLLVYDSNDRFNLAAGPATIDAFEAALAAALGRDTPGVSLAWSNYVLGSDRRVTEYTLR